MLDSSVYLASFGWKGKGNGLRQNSASRPLAIPQKRTLAGLGKDRDEAFPFWDHVFAAAAKSIQIKVSGDDVGNENDPFPQVNLLRTTTGILSNRRPVTGTPATSGSATPDTDAQYSIPRLNLLAIAKRESARKRLYAGFFRGPILGPDAEHDTMETTKVVPQPVEVQNNQTRSDQAHVEQQQRKPKEKKKRKRDDVESTMHDTKKGKKKKRQLHDRDATTEETKPLTPQDDHQDGKQEPKAKRDERENAEEKRNRRLAKAERKKLKEERRKREEERRKVREERRKSGTTVSPKD